MLDSVITPLALLILAFALLCMGGGILFYAGIQIGKAIHCGVGNWIDNRHARRHPIVGDIGNMIVRAAVGEQ